MNFQWEDSCTTVKNPVGSVVTVIEIGTKTTVFLAISNPIETAVLGSLLTVSVFLVFETTGNNAALMSRPNSRQQ